MSLKDKIAESGWNINKADGLPGEAGVTGLNRDNTGYIFEEFLPQLSDDKGRRVFQEMRDNDPVIGGILFAIDMLVRSVDWRVESHEADPKFQKDAEFLMSCMDDMSHTWDDFISEVFSMAVFGWSYHEIVYKKRSGEIPGKPGSSSQFDDGKVGWRKLPIRAQVTRHHWMFDDSGGIQGMIQLAPPNYKMTDLPIEKCLLFRTKSFKNNPEGKSILRNAYRSWFFKKRIEEIEGIGIERDLAGLPAAWVDPRIMAADASAEEKLFLEAIKDLVVNVKRDSQEGIVFPLQYDANGNKMYDFTLINSGGNRQFDTTKIVNRYNNLIASSVLADFILLGQDGTGSFALGSSKANLFAMALGAWLDSVAQTINRHAVPRLFAMNNMPTDKLPKLTYRPIAANDLGEIGQFLVQATGAGAELFPDERLEEHIRQVAGFPAPLPQKVRASGREDKAKEEAKFARLFPQPAVGGGLNPRGGQKTGPDGKKINPAPRSPGSRGAGPRNPGLSNKPGAG